MSFRARVFGDHVARSFNPVRTFSFSMLGPQEVEPGGWPDMVITEVEKIVNNRFGEGMEAILKDNVTWNSKDIGGYETRPNRIRRGMLEETSDFKSRTFPSRQVRPQEKDNQYQGADLTAELRRPTSTTATNETALMEPPYEPSDNEKHLYYYGLHSRPKLVARSSGHIWREVMEDEHPVYKVLDTVGAHPIVDIWRTTDIPEWIMATLKSLDWNAIDILRVGYKSTVQPVTLMVSVLPGSTSWCDAMEVAVACKTVLARYGVLDVECEIRESVVFSLGESNVCGPRLLPLKDGLKLEGERQVSELLGQAVAASKSPPPYPEGSLSLYLEVGSDKDVCALTARHVVFSDETVAAAMTEYQFKHGRGQPKMSVIQPGVTTFGNTSVKMAQVIKAYKGKHDYLLEKKERTEEDEKLMVEYQKLHDRANKLDGTLKLLKNNVTREIGHVLYAPARDKKGEWLQDWVLIKLEKEKYTTMLKDLPNAVWLGELSSDEYSRLTETINSPFKLPGGDPILRLQGTIPLEEITRTTLFSSNEPPLQVGKFGKASRLTWGKSNELLSIRRIKPGCKNEYIISREWCVLALDGFRGPFSRDGDSGAVVFDIKGRIGGIITGGLGWCADRPELDPSYARSTDITYVTPIEIILEGIEKKFGSVKIL